MVGSLLSVHGEAPLGRVLAWAKDKALGAGVYLVPAPPWVRLYHEAVEAQEDPDAIRAFLEELSQLGKARAFPSWESSSRKARMASGSSWASTASWYSLTQGGAGTR
ncbi:hypothetical protein [Thermus scotoductus]|uniref:hypothetical protein n=1 Tax=Thermus scotoductus TaxID=37636 RepID=UPI003F510E6E